MSNYVYKKSFLIRSFAGLGNWAFPLAFFFDLAFVQKGGWQTTLISPTADGGFELTGRGGTFANNGSFFIG